MILLSIVINIIKLSYQAVLYQILKSITKFDDVIEFHSPRRFFKAIKYLDIILLQMASITFISRLTAVSPKIFGDIRFFIDYSFSSSRLLQTVGISLYNTFALAVFTSFAFSFYQEHISDVFYSMIKTLLLFINDMYLESITAFLNSESIENIVS